MLLSPISFDASIPNFLIESISKETADNDSRIITTMPFKMPLKCPINAIGISIVTPIASTLLKQKNSLNPNPVSAANKGPIYNIYIGFEAIESRKFCPPSCRKRKLKPRHPINQRT